MTFFLLTSALPPLLFMVAVHLFLDPVEVVMEDEVQVEEAEDIASAPTAVQKDISRRRAGSCIPISDLRVELDLLMLRPESPTCPRRTGMRS